MKKTLKRIVSVFILLSLVSTLFMSTVAIPASALSYSGSTSYKSGKYYTALTNVTLTGNQRTDIVNVAKSQIGYQEGSNSSQLSGEVKGSANYTEYGRWYGLQDMWCAMFVSWCANVAGVSTSVIPKHSYTPTGLSWFQNKGQAYSRATVASGGYTPQAGDIIYFKSSRNSNPTNHIGIVTGYSSGTVYTIEGNTSSETVSTNGGAVASKSYSISNTYIVYICKPSYPSNNPTGCFDTATGGEGTVTIRGWAFDKDDTSQSLKVNVYIGGSKDSSDAELHTVTANTSRPDVHNVYGCGNNHGFDAVLSTTKVGSQSVYIYAVNIGQGTDVLLGSKTVTINPKLNTDSPVNLGTNFYAQIGNVGSSKNVAVSGDNVLIYTKTKNNDQIWKFDRNSDGSYKITNTSNGKCLDVANGADANETNVILSDSNDTESQKWFVYSYGGNYALKSACTSRVLNVAGGSSADMTNVQTYTFNASNAQFYTFDIWGYDIGDSFDAYIYNTITYKPIAADSTGNVILTSEKGDGGEVWTFTRNSNGSYKISDNNGNCLEAKDGVDANGTNVEISADNGGISQMWYIDGSLGNYILRPLCATNRALDVYEFGEEDGTNIQIWVKANNTAQSFQLTKIGEDIGTDFYANIEGVSSGKLLSAEADNDVTILGATDGKEQIWKFERQADNSYKIINVSNEYVLSVENSTTKTGANVQISASNDTNAQRWFIHKQGDGYRLENKATFCTLDIESDETNTRMYSPNNSASQTFKINEVEDPNPELLIGDINQDGVINVMDVTELQKLLVKNTDYSVNNLQKICDVNVDGVINVFDVTQIQKYCVGMVKSLG